MEISYNKIDNNILNIYKYLDFYGFLLESNNTYKLLLFTKDDFSKLEYGQNINSDKLFETIWFKDKYYDKLYKQEKYI